MSDDRVRNFRMFAIKRISFISDTFRGDNLYLLVAFSIPRGRP